MYIIKITFTYPRDKFQPPPAEKIPGLDNILQLREEFVRDEKILAVDSQTNNENYSITNTVVYKSKAEFQEWTSHPQVIEFFNQRDQYLLAHGIVKSSEVEEFN